MKKKKITTDTIISQIEEIVASDIDGETVMMSIENGEYYALDEIGSHTWELIQKATKVSDVIETIREESRFGRKSSQQDIQIPQ